MTTRIDLYTSDGTASGELAQPGRLAERLERATEFELGDATWAPFDGPVVHARSRVRIAVDDVLLAHDPDDDDLPVHAMWHPVLIDAGPYRVQGELPTQPGFDPGRALTRPSGTFLRLRDVRIVPRGRPDLSVDRGSLLVSRYGVERVQAGLMLGFFFPGAEIEEGRDVQPVSPVAG